MPCVLPLFSATPERPRKLSLGAVEDSRLSWLDTPSTYVGQSPRPPATARSFRSGKSRRVSPRKQKGTMSAMGRWDSKHHLMGSTANTHFHPRYREYFDAPKVRLPDGTFRFPERLVDARFMASVTPSEGRVHYTTV